MLNNIIYRELSYTINGLCFRVHNELGRFCREKQYANRFEQLLNINGIKYVREIKIPFVFKDELIDGNIADFLIEDKIILECKAEKFITKKDYYQIQRYLKAANKNLGIIVNFNDKYLKPRRIINYSQIRINS